MSAMSLKEFKPTIIFLVKFVGMYVIANLLYGLFVSGFGKHPDPATSAVSFQTSTLLDVCGWTTRAMDNPSGPTTDIWYKDRTVLAVYEGCNGLNVMIIFVAFLFAFGPISKRMFWFIPLGLLVIHLVNLLRVALLFWVAMYKPDQMYFLHKYLFTAVIYIAVFGLWVFWVRRYSNLGRPQPS